ncbi:hypothetical protein Sango_2962800 [Sesamum angolense]|uniref:Uncharacterized protein n=1 Tax=Sesamum angolense TaxID=2727404 RepID=A0AAE1VZS5_9LAMI|nr:hypothetical protein Sango_2962800 [Sesamum angolense]
MICLESSKSCEEVRQNILRISLDENGEASTSKAKGKKARCWNRKKGKAKEKAFFAHTSTKSTLVAPKGMGKEGGKLVLNSSRGKMIFVSIAVRKGIRGWIGPNSLPGKISKDKVVLKLGDAKAIIAETIGTFNLVAKGGFFYFITFTDDHSWYGYLYLMRYKSKAFVRFKEFRLEREHQTSAILKPFGQTEKSDLVGPGLVNDEFYRTALCFWGYALDMTTRLLNVALERSGSAREARIIEKSQRTNSRTIGTGNPNHTDQAVRSFHMMIPASHFSQLTIWPTNPLKLYGRPTSPADETRLQYLVQVSIVSSMPNLEVLDLERSRPTLRSWFHNCQTYAQPNSMG